MMAEPTEVEQKTFGKATMNGDSKVMFRARALDLRKPLMIYNKDEMGQLPNFKATSRVVPQMPSGMERTEENELHLQKAMTSGQTIPVPGVETVSGYETLYPDTVSLPKTYILEQPCTDENIPSYDIDSEDDAFLKTQIHVPELKFEKMMEKFEKESVSTVVRLDEAKALFPEDDVTTLAVYEYWLNKRLKTKSPLMPTVPFEVKLNSDQAYAAFRKRIDKRITRRNRRNDEISYFKMIRLKNDLARAAELVELVRKRDELKKSMIKLQIEILDKRFAMQDFSNRVYKDVVRENNEMLPFAKFAGKKKKDRRKRGEDEEEDPFVFRRMCGCEYLAPRFGESEMELGETLQIVSEGAKRTLRGRRRMGRGGRIIFDRFPRVTTSENISDVDNVENGDYEDLFVDVESVDDGGTFRAHIRVRDFRVEPEKTEVLRFGGKIGFREADLNINRVLN